MLLSLLKLILICLPFLSILFIGFVIVNNADDNHPLLGVYFIYKDMERTDIYFVEDDTYFNNNVEGVEIHAECLSQDFDDIAWEPIVDDSPIVDPENDVFGYYN
ncbi:MAG: hypothetical protein [Bacteriophage sp.]|nr:MAG: hypothetical protein [Bacteriophage sp.]